MSKPSPQEIYRHLCQRLRHRIELADAICNSAAPKWQVVETVSLQGRKSIETIAHMCLVATEHSLGELGIPKDAKQHWNAETIFQRLKKRGITALPSPSAMSTSDDPRFEAVFTGVPEYRLSYDDLIVLYRKFHEGLHDANPYRLADTAESLIAHRKRDFSTDPFASYIEFWGVMQAVVIQQDAIQELHQTIAKGKLKPSYASAWMQLRAFRNASAGHPANRTRGVPAPQRSFMGRLPRTYSNVQYELWDAHTRRTSHPVVDLGALLDQYDDEASQALATILSAMKLNRP